MGISLSEARAIDYVRDSIRRYESDTFSASGSKITENEIRAVVALLIMTRIQPGLHVDGVTLTSLLAEVRGQ